MVYTSIKEFWENDNFEWIVKNEAQGINEFLEKQEKKISQSDLVFICTALDNFKAFYSLVSKSHAALVVHNAHSFLDPENHISLNNQEPIKDRLRLLKTYGNRSHFYKSEILKALKGLVFPTPIILEYVQNNFKLPQNLLLTAQPFSYNHRKLRKIVSPIKIAIPGTVDPNVRNYESVLSAFQSIKNKLQHPIQIVLLGIPVPKGIEILNKFKNLENKNITVLTFQDYIAHDQYQAHLLTSSFLILPLKRVVRNYIYREQMGFSKISGSINDMIRWGIPAFIPEHFPLEDDLSEITQTYKNHDLAERLLNRINNFEKTKSFEKANKLARVKSRENMQQQLLNFIKKLI